MFSHDHRFSYQNYGHQPRWLIRQALNSVCDRRNLDQQSTVRLTYTVMGMFGKPSIEIHELFPHPLHWQIKHNPNRMPISKRTAQIVLATMGDYPECRAMLAQIMTDIHAAIIS